MSAKKQNMLHSMREMAQTEEDKKKTEAPKTAVENPASGTDEEESIVYRYNRLQEERAEKDRIRKSNIRSKRLQLSMTPDLHKKVKAIADEEGISVNEFINRAIEDAVILRNNPNT